MEDTSRRGTCPHCGATYAYPDSVRLSDGTVKCHNCEALFMPSGEVLYSEPNGSDAAPAQGIQCSETWPIVVIVVLELLFLDILLLVVALPITVLWWTRRSKNRRQHMHTTSSESPW